MIKLILTRRPNSYNSNKGRKRDQYAIDLKSAFDKYENIKLPKHMLLYGMIYHFFNVDKRIDADNISKPVWDCLKDVAFDDDFQVKYRISASIKSDVAEIKEFPITDDLSFDFAQAYQAAEHLLYIEIGEFSGDLMKINLEQS